MSTTEFSFLKAKSGVRVADFIAFVADRKTEQVLKSFVLEQAMPHVHIAVGGIDDAIAYLSKIETGQLEVGTPADSYLRSGTFSADEMIDYWGEEAAA